MRAPISVIIPTLDAGQALGPCLGALGEGLEAGLIRELIISDGGSTDGTLALAEAAGARVVSGPAGRGGQLARGAEAAGGAWLLFLHADSWLAPGWAPVVAAHLSAGEGRAGYFRLRFRAPGPAPRLVAGWANLRARAFGLPYGDQGLLISRRLYDAVGGYAALPLMEDVAMARALGRRKVALPALIETGAERYLSRGWLRQGAANLWRLGRFWAGVPAERLAAGYGPAGDHAQAQGKD